MGLGEDIRRIINKISGKLIDETTVKSLTRDLQRALILADVNVQLVYDLSKRIEERSLREKPQVGMSANEHVTKVIYEELVKLMGEGEKLNLKKQKIMLVGLFGSGKTTTASKIALYFKRRGLSVGLIAADVTRPAAVEQLQQLSEKVGCNFYGEKGKKAWEVVSEGLKKLKDEVIIVDTSGRNALDQDLIEELKKVNEVLKPDLKLLVISADTGQVAKKQTEEFHKAIGLNGVVITKMDGSGKGGGAISAAAASGAKIIFIGTGEKLEDLEEFNPEKFVGQLLGIPDFESLIKKIRETAPELDEMKPPEKFDIKTFYEQLKAAKRLGPLKGILQSIGFVDVPKEVLEESEQKLSQYEAIISSMTKEEREDAEIVRKSPSRIMRIALGSGTKPEAVKSFLDQFAKMKKVYDQLKTNRGLQKQLERFLKKR